MRWALLLTPILLLGFIQLPAASQIQEAGPKVVVGPLLTPPSPSVYATIPYVLQPTGQPVSITPALPQEDIVILMIEFSDQAASPAHSTQYFDDLLFDNTPGASSLSNFYLENSYGQTVITGAVSSQWYMSDRTMLYYGADGSGVDDENGPVYCLTAEAVVKADPFINFAQFDRDGNGVVDHLVVIHSGNGQEKPPASANDIWSHRWAVIDATDCGLPARNLITNDGVQIYGYYMASESSPMGVFAHELGHDFGLPDLYDTTQSTLGIGVWGVMGTGSWNGNPEGSSPAHFTAWSKAKLGWLELTEITSALVPASIPRVEDNALAYKLPVKVSVGGDEEYFIVENRQPAGFDSGLPSGGLLIWHVDENRENNDVASLRLVDLEEADDGRGILFADKPTQPTDPWSDNEEGFHPTSTPGSTDNSGAETGWKVTGIGPSGAVMVANISKGIAIDVAILSIDKRDFVELNRTADVAVTVLNKGLTDVDNATLSLNVYYEAYEESSRIYNLEVPLPTLVADETTTVPYSFTPTQQGRYLIEAFVDVEGDGVPVDNYRFVHIVAGNHLLLEDVEGSVAGWSNSTNPGSLYRWEVVEDGDGYGYSYSPVRAWRFGYFGPQGPVVNYTYYYLVSPTLQIEEGALGLFFYQRYELTRRTEGSLLQPLESDVATVEASFDGGPWIQLDSYRGIQLTWRRAYVDLAPDAGGASEVTIRFNATARVMPDTGGWWIDDIVVSTQPAVSAALVKPLNSQGSVVPGATVSFQFVLVNVGDVLVEFHFEVTGLPSDWDALIGTNQTSAVAVEDYAISLDVDEQQFLTLIVRAPILAERGVSLNGILVVTTPTSGTLASFMFTVEVPVTFGFNLGGRTLVVTLIIAGVMLALAVVLTALRKRHGY